MTKIKFSKIYAIIFVVVSFALSIILADLMSNVITVGSFSYNYSGIQQNEFDIYAISLAKAVSITQATEISLSHQKQNSAGYVWIYQGECHVFASAYESENDAIKVQAKLKEQSINSTIVKITFPAVKVSGEFNQLEKSSLLSALSIFKETYLMLYDSSVCLDTQTKNDIEVLVSIGDIKASIAKIKSDFDSHFNSKITNHLLAIKLKLSKLADGLEELIDGEKNTTVPFSAKLKEQYFKVLKLYFDLSEEM